MSQSRSISHLFRMILKEHRKLSLEMKVIGDNYVRNEFKLHLKAKPDQLKQFYLAWDDYLSQIQQQNEDTIGHDLNEDSMKYLNSEQQMKLKELKDEVDSYTKP